MSSSGSLERGPAIVLPGDGRWRPADPPVLLALGATRAEQRLIAEAAPSIATGVRVVSDGRAAVAAARDGDRVIAPVKVIWGAAAGAPGRGVRLRDLAVAEAPAALRAPLQQRLLGRNGAGRRILVGEAASLGELETRCRERTGAPTDDEAPLAAFIERQADIVLERAERRLTADRFRAPRRVVEELTDSAEWTEGIAELARRLGRDADGVASDARHYLEEMSTEQQPLAREVWVRWSRFLYSRAYELRYDPAQIEEIRALSERHPLVFLPTHRSNLDGFVMAALLRQAGLPPNHALGGINMAFWPLGALGRRVGVIFIRRSFRDNEIYKWVLRRYLGFLAAKRFNLEWYIEGGRSRTGKLLPPRMGLFNYVCDAVEERGIDDLHVIPVSIVYDELQEVHEMTTESRGAKKQAEGLPWLIDFARSQRGSFGAVHVNFGAPLRLTDALRAAEGDSGGDRRLARSKAAFEVCTRINRATPVTTTSLVTLGLLGVGGRALTAEEIDLVLAPLLRYVAAQRIPGHEECAALAGRPVLEATLGTLESHGVVERFADGPEPVYRIGPDHELVAAFYRNQGIHWFLNRAIVELALIGVAEGDHADPAQAALDDAFALRDLLKMEFFFAEKDEFREELGAEMALIEPTWRDRGAEWLTSLGESFAASGALMAHRVLRSFVEAYAIAADTLAGRGDRTADVEEMTKAALALGRQYHLQERVQSAEALSTHLFASAYKLAANRGLLAGGAGQGERRAAFAAEVTDVLRRLCRIDDMDRALRPEPTGGRGR